MGLFFSHLINITYKCSFRRGEGGRWQTRRFDGVSIPNFLHSDSNTYTPTYNIYIYCIIVRQFFDSVCCEVHGERGHTHTTGRAYTIVSTPKPKMTVYTATVIGNYHRYMTHDTRHTCHQKEEKGGAGKGIL